MKTIIKFYDWRKRTPLYDYIILDSCHIPRKDEVILLDEIEHEVVYVEHKFYMEDNVQQINIYLIAIL